MTLRKRRLGELRDRHLEVARSVRGELGVRHLEVEDAVDLQLGVVLGDADLAGHVERDFPQVVPVGDAIDERDHEIEAGLQHRVEPPQPLDDERVLLRNDPDRLGDDDDGHDEQRDREQRRPDPHGVGLHLRPGHWQRLPVGQHEHRAAHRGDVHRLAARHVGASQFGVPIGSTVGHARRAVGPPAFDPHRLADVERRLGRRHRTCETPAVRGDRQHQTEHAGDRELHRHAGAQPGGDAPGGNGDAHRQKVERADQELDADQHDSRDPPDPESTHRQARLRRARRAPRQA